MQRCWVCLQWCSVCPQTGSFLINSNGATLTHTIFATLHWFLLPFRGWDLHGWMYQTVLGASYWCYVAMWRSTLAWSLSFLAGGASKRFGETRGESSGIAVTDGTTPSESTCLKLSTWVFHRAMFPGIAQHVSLMSYHLLTTAHHPQTCHLMRKIWTRLVPISFYLIAHHRSVPVPTRPFSVTSMSNACVHNPKTTDGPQHIHTWLAQCLLQCFPHTLTWFNLRVRPHRCDTTTWCNE